MAIIVFEFDENGIIMLQALFQGKKICKKEGRWQLKFVSYNEMKTG